MKKILLMAALAVCLTSCGTVVPQHAESRQVMPDSSAPAGIPATKGWLIQFATLNGVEGAEITFNAHDRYNALREAYQYQFKAQYSTVLAPDASGPIRPGVYFINSQNLWALEKMSDWQKNGVLPDSYFDQFKAFITPAK